MNLSDKKGVQHIVETLAKLGLKEVVICPGSRNAPLTISFNRHPAFRCTSIRDERSAAFFALGKAIELKEPTAVVCTSGSAALNFAPAISEAFYQRIPLMVITADRPKEWTGQGDGQTINQTNLYQNIIRKSYELKGDANTPSDLWYNSRSLCEGWSIGNISDKGPVHFNIPFHEPLYETAEPEETEVRIFSELATEKRLLESELSHLSQIFTECRKVMILAGQHHVDDAFRKELSAMAAFDNVIILTESTSNIHNSLFVENIDRVITGMNEAESAEFMPELLITIGGAIVSKRIKATLRRFRPKYHWNVDPFDCMMDTYQSLTSAIPLNASEFFSQLRLKIKNVLSDYRMIWQDRKVLFSQLHEEFVEHCEYSDLHVFHKLFQRIPENTHLQLSNSSPVRYAQLFDNSRIAESWSNRGTSGIDGCTSTAMGCAVASPDKNFLLVTGDIAFQYDNNGLWVDEVAENLKIMVINNGGGGIFRIISGPGIADELEKFFETSTHSSIEKLARHYKWDYLAATDKTTLEKAWEDFFNPAKGRIILEVFTDAVKNPQVLEKYWKFLKEKSKV